MSAYLYDGSFDSLLGLCGTLVEKNILPDDIRTEAQPAADLFESPVLLKSDQKMAETLFNEIKSHSSPYQYICGGFLSELPGSEMAIFHFIRAIKTCGYPVSDNLADDRVMTIFRMQQKVFIELHRMLGLLRFSELSDGTYYALYEPDHNISALLAPHFARRIPRQNWIIHDISRSLGAIYQAKLKQWELFDIDGSQPIRYSEGEAECRRIWRRYYQEISIPERKNPFCQKRFMPERYWKHLIEEPCGAALLGIERRGQ